MKPFVVFFAVLFFGLVSMLFFLFGTESHRGPVTRVIAEPLLIDVPTEQALLEFQDFVQSGIDNGRVPGVAVAVVRGGDIIYLKGFGKKEVGHDERIDTHTLFRLGSVSKSVTSTLAGRLVQEGVIGWDDPVSKYLPDFKLKTQEATDSLRVKHLISHTTGLPYHAYTNLIEEGYDLGYLIDKLQEVDLVSEAGEFYSYQNVAYSLLEQLVQAATGKSFDQLMNEKVFGPLRMSQSSVTYHDFMRNNNAAHPHLFRGKTWRPVSLSKNYYNVAPAGGINSSISDMAKWMQAMLGHKTHVISKETLDQLYEPRIRATAKNRNFYRWNRIRKSYYGYGWRILQFNADTLAYHGGYVNGFRAEVALNRDEDLGICVLTNAPGDFSDVAIPTFLTIYDRYLNVQRKESAANAVAP